MILKKLAVHAKFLFLIILNYELIYSLQIFSFNTTTDTFRYFTSLCFIAVILSDRLINRKHFKNKILFILYFWTIWYYLVHFRGLRIQLNGKLAECGPILIIFHIKLKYKIFNQN